MKTGQKRQRGIANEGDFSVLVHPLTKEEVRLHTLNNTSSNRRHGISDLL
jgi:aromatic ring-cleaving dioxygenase